MGVLLALRKFLKKSLPVMDPIVFKYSLKC